MSYLAKFEKGDKNIPDDANSASSSFSEFSSLNYDNTLSFTETLTNSNPTSIQEFSLPSTSGYSSTLIIIVFSSISAGLFLIALILLCFKRRRIRIDVQYMSNVRKDNSITPSTTPELVPKFNTETPDIEVGTLPRSSLSNLNTKFSVQSSLSDDNLAAKYLMSSVSETNTTPLPSILNFTKTEVEIAASAVAARYSPVKYSPSSQYPFAAAKDVFLN